jgi:predicted membrane protein
MLDLIHRIYEADESFRSLDFMVHTKLFVSQIVLQLLVGTLTPIILLGIVQVTKLPALIRRRIYVIAGCLVQIGIFSMRWNVVIGGQLFSKSFLGYTTYKMSLVTKEGLLAAIALSILPLIILSVLVKLLPPWPENELGPIDTASTATMEAASTTTP